MSQKLSLKQDCIKVLKLQQNCSSFKLSLGHVDFSKTNPSTGATQADQIIRCFQLCRSWKLTRIKIPVKATSAHTPSSSSETPAKAQKIIVKIPLEKEEKPLSSKPQKSTSTHAKSHFLVVREKKFELLIWYVLHVVLSLGGEKKLGKKKLEQRIFMVRKAKDNACEIRVETFEIKRSFSGGFLSAHSGLRSITQLIRRKVVRQSVKTITRKIELTFYCVFLSFQIDRYVYTKQLNGVSRMQISPLLLLCYTKNADSTCECIFALSCSELLTFFLVFLMKNEAAHSIGWNSWGE